MFGFDLFGRPPIQLPDDDTEDALLFRRHRSGSGSTPTTLIAQTFDSDVAPLDISTVAKATEAAEAEAKRLKEKEERRRERKAKEMKRLVEASVMSLKIPGEWLVGSAEES